MRFLGIKSLPPFSIDLPLGIMFPLHRRPRLSVVVREKGVPDAARSPTLTIETTNAAQEAVVVTGVYAGYIYGNTLVEVAVGRRTVKLPLLELEDEVRLPFVLGVGEAATCTANLYQLRKQLEENYLTLHPHSRFLEFNRIDRERWASYGRSAIMLRNRVAMLSSRRLVVVIGDDQGALHKAKVRWEPPGAGPPTSEPLAALYELASTPRSCGVEAILAGLPFQRPKSKYYVWRCTKIPISGEYTYKLDTCTKNRDKGAAGIREREPRKENTPPLPAVHHRATPRKCVRIYSRDDLGRRAKGKVAHAV